MCKEYEIKIEIKTKVCRKCGKELPMTKEYFEVNKQYRNGFTAQCRECISIKRRERQGAVRVNNKWTNKDIDILNTYYSTMSTNKIAELYMPYRTISQIQDYAIKKLNLHKNEDYLKIKIYDNVEVIDWSKTEIETLEKHYKTTSNDEMVGMLNRSKEAIITKANRLGLYKNSDIKNIKHYKLKLHSSVYIYKCDNCGKSIIRKYKSQYNNIFCDKACLSQWQSLNTKGDKSVRFNSELVKCECCDKLILRTPYKINLNNINFCSRECMGKWKSENECGENNHNFGTVWNAEMRLKGAERAVKMLMESDFTYRQTKPQLITDNLLNELNIVNENEYSCKYYLMDNYLNDYNLMIEVQGNFFHCNPVMNLNNSRRTKILGKDKAKHTYVKRYYGIEILYLWEKDITQKLELCRQLILKYINNNGILEDYHSYNYCLDENNKIKIIENKYVIGY